MASTPTFDEIVNALKVRLTGQEIPVGLPISQSIKAYSGSVVVTYYCQHGIMTITVLPVQVYGERAPILVSYFFYPPRVAEVPMPIIERPSRLPKHPIPPTPPPPPPPPPPTLSNGGEGDLGMLTAPSALPKIPLTDTVSYRAITTLAIPTIGCLNKMYVAACMRGDQEPINMMAETLSPDFSDLVNGVTPLASPASGTITYTMNQDTLELISYPKSYSIELPNPMVLEITLNVIPSLLFVQVAENNVDVTGYSYSEDIYVIGVKTANPYINEIVINSASRIKIYSSGTNLNDYIGQTLPIVEVPITYSLKNGYIPASTQVDAVSSGGRKGWWNGPVLGTLEMSLMGSYTLICQTSSGAIFDLHVPTTCDAPLLYDKTGDGEYPGTYIAGGVSSDNLNAYNRTSNGLFNIMHLRNIETAF